MKYSSGAKRATGEQPVLQIAQNQQRDDEARGNEEEEDAVAGDESACDTR